MTAKTLLPNRTEQAVEGDHIEQDSPYDVYLANRMSGIPEFNFPWFAKAAEYLRHSRGWGVKNPAEKDLEAIPYEKMVTIPGYEDGDLATYCANSSFTMSNAMEWDLPAILDSRGIVLGDGWAVSTGARWERLVAEALDRDVWLLHGDGSKAAPFLLVLDDEPKRITNFLRDFGEAGTYDTLEVSHSTGELIRELERRLSHSPNFKEHFPKAISGLAPSALA